jgi:hypothetical protein
MLGTRSASQKFPKFGSRAGTGFSTDKWGLVALSARILSIYPFFGDAFIVLLFFSPVKIEEVKEQRVRIKFYFKLGISAADTQKIIKQELDYDALAQPQSTTGFTGLKMAERQLTMTNVLGELQSAHGRKTLQKCVRLSARIVGERSMMFATLWDRHRGHAGALCRPNST